MEQKKQQNQNNNKKPNTSLNILIIALLLTFAYNIFSTTTALKNMREITYSKFLDLVEEGKVEKVELQAGKLLIYPKYELIEEKDNLPKDSFGNMPLYTGRFIDYNLKETLRENNVEFKAPIVENNAFINSIINYVIPIIFTYIILYLIFMIISKKSSGSIFSIGKANTKVYVQKETGITFKDVAGQEEAKESLKEIVDFLNNPEKYSKIGAIQPKGALLVGPPGTGKTLLAKAVAGEANVTFLSISGSDFIEMYVGVGASRVRNLYKQAIEKAPCIVFIDEIDAIGKTRNSRNSNDEREQTLNQLLSEMDGFDSSKGIVVLAATNRPEVLDKALLRPGRFDRRIIVEKPDLKGREDILKVHTKKIILDNKVDLKKVALATSGATGADLANMVNEAALTAVRLNKEKVTQEDLLEAVEIVIAGKEKKDRILSEKEKRIVAFHEVGHALTTALQKNSQPVQKITIVPRTMGALGYTMQVPEEEKFLQSKDDILDQITVLLAGRAAEEIEFNSITTGASNDIEKATELARAMVTQFGMTDKFDMVKLENVENKYLEGSTILNCSNETFYEIDKEVIKIIKSCHKKALDILNENREALTKISEYLISKESITGEEFMDILKDILGEDFKYEKPKVKKTLSIQSLENNLSNLENSIQNKKFKNLILEKYKKYKNKKK